MFFLLRLLLRIGFWPAMVLAIISLAGRPTSGTDAELGPLEAISAAGSAIKDVAGICDRQPDVCVAGTAAARLIAARVRDAAQMIQSGHDAQEGLPEPTVTGTIPVPTPRPPLPVPHLQRATP